MLDISGLFLVACFSVMALCILGCFAIYFGLSFKFKDFTIFINPDKAVKENPDLVKEMEELSRKVEDLQFLKK